MSNGGQRDPQPWGYPTSLMDFVIKLAFWFRSRLQGQTCYKVDWWPLLCRGPSVRYFRWRREGLLVVYCITTDSLGEGILGVSDKRPRPFLIR